MQKNSLRNILLSDLDLSEREALLFCELLKAVKATASELAKKLDGIPRTSVYDILLSLQSRGLVNVVEEGEKKYFQGGEVEEMVESLEREKHALTERQENLRTIADTVRHIQTGNAYRPRVRFFEGKRGIFAMHSEMKHAKKDTYTIANIAAIAKSFPEIVGGYDLFKGFPQEIVRKDRFIKNREAQQYLALGNPVTGSHRVKWLPEGTEFHSDTFIRDSHVAMIDYTQKLVGVIIDNPAIAHTFRSWFEIMWNSIPTEVQVHQ